MRGGRSTRSPSDWAAVATCLIGHSLGGRAALLAAGAPEVRSAVALAPWVLPSDRPADLAGRRILIVHGARDRVASPRRSGALAQAIAAEADVNYVCVEDGSHAMLRRHALFDGLAADFAAVTCWARRPVPRSSGCSTPEASLASEAASRPRPIRARAFGDLGIPPGTRPPR